MEIDYCAWRCRWFGEMTGCVAGDGGGEARRKGARVGARCGWMWLSEAQLERKDSTALQTVGGMCFALPNAAETLPRDSSSNPLALVSLPVMPHRHANGGVRRNPGDSPKGQYVSRAGGRCICGKLVKELERNLARRPRATSAMLRNPVNAQRTDRHDDAILRGV